MGIPQFLIVSLYAMSLGMSLANHGKPREGKHNFWIALFTYVIIMILLKWSGFFG